MDFILHKVVTLDSANNLATISLMMDHSKVTKIHFWMIQSAKKVVFGNFLDLRLLDWLDIAYYDSTKCVPTFANTTRSERIIQKSIKCIFEWSKVPERGVLATFLSLVCWINLILHIVIVLKVFDHFATLPGHAGSFKNQKNAFLNDPKSQKRGFWSFSVVWSVGSTWYCILW